MSQTEHGSTGRDATEHLQATLVELIDLSLQAKQAHWNVVGPRFDTVHRLLDDVAADCRDWYDVVAERMTALGTRPDGTLATVLASTGLPAMPTGRIEDHAALALLDERVTIISLNVSHRVAEMGSTDPVTQSVLVEIMGGLDKRRWMIRASAPRPIAV